MKRNDACNSPISGGNCMIVYSIILDMAIITGRLLMKYLINSILLSPCLDVEDRENGTKLDKMVYSV